MTEGRNKVEHGAERSNNFLITNDE